MRVEGKAMASRGPVRATGGKGQEEADDSWDRGWEDGEKMKDRRYIQEALCAHWCLTGLW